MSNDTDGGVAVEELVSTAKRRWLAVLLIAALGAAAAFAVTALTPPKYESVGKVLVGDVEGPTDSIRASASIGSTYAGILTSENVLRRSADLADIPASVEDEDLREAVDVTSSDRTRLVTVTTTWDDPVTARRMTTALMWHVVAFREELPDRSAPAVADLDIMEQRRREASTGQVTIVAPASDAERPVDVPQWVFVLLAGLLAGAVAFGIFAFLDQRRARQRAQVARTAADYGLLGEVAVDRRVMAGRRSPVVVRRPDSAEAAEYRTIASRAVLRATGRPLASLAVLGTRRSAASREVAVNLALALAGSGREVRFVELTGSPAALDMLRAAEGQESDGRLSVTTPAGGRVTLPVGEAATPGPDAVAGVPASEVHGVPDRLVVVHADPLLVAPDTLAVLRQVDAVALVLEEDSADPDRDLEDASGAISRHGTTLLGTVVARGSALADDTAQATGDAPGATGGDQRTGSFPATNRKEQHQHHEV